MAEPGGDRELVRRCIAGEGRAWEDLIRDHVDRLYRCVATVLAVPGGATRDGEVEDVLQSLFLKLWEDDRRRLRTWQGRSRLSTWLVTVARREALDHLKRQRRGRRHAVPLPSGNGTRFERLLGELEVGPLEELETAERDRRVQDAVSRLPRQENLLVRLVYFDEASYRDAASILGVPLNSISPWLVRARGRLRTLLRDSEPEGAWRKNARPAR